MTTSRLVKYLTMIQCISLSCCTTPINNRREKNDIYSFGIENSECLQWTDWNKLCWRASQRSEILCISEKKYIASASKPFCTISRDKSLLRGITESRNRFCEKTNVGGECEKYKDKRPFNGLGSYPMEEWCSFTKTTSNIKNNSISNGKLMICSKWKKNIPCSSPIGGTYAPMVNIEGVIISRVPNPQSRPVWGIYCLD